jgi:uncharacterized protein (TIGR02284 family)
MKHRFTIVTLGELLVVTENGESGYTTCAQHTREESLKQVFVSRARRLAGAAAELRALIAQLGGDPAIRARVPGADDRGWVNLEAMLALNDDDSLVGACEHGEDHALEVYRNALDDPLPDFVRHMVLRQFEDLMSEHDQIRIHRNEPPPGGGVVAGGGGHARQ